MSDIDISVVVPAYNEVETIDRCIESILGQKDPPQEVVIVDDCSDDGTSAILERYDITVLRNAENQGVTESVARGVHHTEGDVVAIVDADSTLPQDWTLKVSEYFTPSVSCIGGHCKPQWINDESVITNLFAQAKIDTKDSKIPTGSGICFDRKQAMESDIFEELPKWGWDTYAPKKFLFEGKECKKIPDLYVNIHERYSLRAEFEKSYRYGKGAVWVQYHLHGQLSARQAVVNAVLVSFPALFGPLIILPLFCIVYIYSFYSIHASDDSTPRFLIEPINRYLKACGELQAIMEIWSSK